MGGSLDIHSNDPVILPVQSANISRREKPPVCAFPKVGRHFPVSTGSDQVMVLLLHIRQGGAFEELTQCYGIDRWMDLKMRHALDDSLLTGFVMGDETTDPVDGASTGGGDFHMCQAASEGIGILADFSPC
jgi:hypothetical protein